ncbi:MAG TPA: NAD(P)-dependent oxidoreductase, partial [Ruminiclostridium sp.]|nr:NAD(P)-dependent oxidoreductase [Ruminiclostridium sp.]
DIFSENGKRSKIVYRPELKNNTPSYLFNMTKAKEDFGFVPQYKSFKDMMLDYKKEMLSGRLDFMALSRRKGK